MHGSDRVPDLRDYKRAWVGKSKPFNESEMALFSECMRLCDRILLDTADIVREAIYRQQLACFSDLPTTRSELRPILAQCATAPINLPT